MKIVLVLLVLYGCAEKLETFETNNADYKVDFLFEHDGCRMYRFKDGRSIYFTKCGTRSMTNRLESCGKNCTHVNQVESDYE